MMKNSMKSRQRMKPRILGEARDAMPMLGGRTGSMTTICHDLSPQSGIEKGTLQTVLARIICDMEQVPSFLFSRAVSLSKYPTNQ